MSLQKIFIKYFLLLNFFSNPTFIFANAENKVLTTTLTFIDEAYTECHSYQQRARKFKNKDYSDEFLEEVSSFYINVEENIKRLNLIDYFPELLPNPRCAMELDYNSCVSRRDWAYEVVIRGLCLHNLKNPESQEEWAGRRPIKRTTPHFDSENVGLSILLTIYTVCCCPLCIFSSALGAAATQGVVKLGYYKCAGTCCHEGKNERERKVNLVKQLQLMESSLSFIKSKLKKRLSRSRQTMER